MTNVRPVPMPNEPMDKLFLMPPSPLIADLAARLRPSTNPADDRFQSSRPARSESPAGRFRKTHVDRSETPSPASSIGATPPPQRRRAETAASNPAADEYCLAGAD